MTGPFGVDISKMAWDEKTTPKYWKIKAMADRGATPEERATWKAKLDQHVKANAERGKPTPPEDTNPEYKPPKPPPGQQSPPSGSRTPGGGFFNADDFMRDFTERMRERQGYARSSARSQAQGEWVRDAQEKINNTERKMYKGKTGSQRKAAYESAKGMGKAKAAWNKMPSGSRTGAKMYAAAGAATAGGAAYVRYKDPNRVHKAQSGGSSYPKYNKNEKRASNVSLGAGLGGLAAAYGGATAHDLHAQDAKTFIDLANKANQAGDQIGAGDNLRVGLKALKYTNRSKAVMHGGLAASGAGLAGLSLTEKHYQNRVKYKRAQKKAKVTPVAKFDARQYKRDDSGQFARVNTLSFRAVDRMDLPNPKELSPTTQAAVVGGATAVAVGLGAGKAISNARRIKIPTYKAAETLNHAKPAPTFKDIGGRGASKNMFGHYPYAYTHAKPKMRSKLKDEAKAADWWSASRSNVNRVRDRRPPRVFHKGRYTKMTHLIDDAPVTDQHLYRGARMKGDHLTQGSIIDMPESSWTHDPRVADYYHSRLTLDHKKGDPTVMHLPKGGRALHLSPVTRYRNGEWVTPKGKYIIDRVEMVDGVRHVYLNPLQETV
jgi:hypothetical protein